MFVTPRIDRPLLREMAAQLTHEDCAEMAIPSYLHDNPLLRSMAWWRVGLLAKRLRNAARALHRQDLRILDFGCGSGVLFADALEVGREVIGVDQVLGAAQLLVERRAYTQVKLLTPSAANEQILPGSVDIIIAGEVLEHVEPLEETLLQFKRWLHRGGQLLATLPTENAIYRAGRRLAGFDGHYHHANAASITRELERCGFRVTHKRVIPLPDPFSVYWCLDLSPT
jgi:2-polyprenyl-3-methyl-5-hydroxy-6-metoxy-1,4-benzoquinol methylase